MGCGGRTRVVPYPTIHHVIARWGHGVMRKAECPLAGFQPVRLTVFLFSDDFSFDNNRIIINFASAHTGGKRQNLPCRHRPSVRQETTRLSNRNN